nr:winged helix-turn-helix domain-containing protein [Actinomadura sp. RB99]
MNDVRTQESRNWHPAYVRAAESLRDWILSGEFEVGATIPSEPDLADQYGISRTSLRNAVRQLRDRGLVATRQGAGTYVLPRDKAPFDGVAIDGQDEAEKAVAATLPNLDPRYIRCEAGHELADLLSKKRIPILPVTDYLRLGPRNEPERWLNALLWSTESDSTKTDVHSTPCILSIRTETPTTPRSAARTTSTTSLPTASVTAPAPCGGPSAP